MSSPGGALSDDSMTRVEPLASLMMGRPVEETSQNGAGSMVASSNSEERGKGVRIQLLYRLGSQFKDNFHYRLVGYINTLE